MRNLSVVKHIQERNKVCAQMAIYFYQFCICTKTIVGKATNELTSKERKKINQDSVNTNPNQNITCNQYLFESLTFSRRKFEIFPPSGWPEKLN